MINHPLTIVIVAGLGVAFGALAPEVMRTTCLDCRCRRESQPARGKGRRRNLVIAATRTDPASRTKKARKGSSK